MGFWSGLAIGMIVGANIGFMVNAMLVAASQEDELRTQLHELEKLRLLAHR
jgi:Na+/phosphate symporter